nr:MAG TPA: hypothetical protein [Caudoviricetes sp.]
MIRSSRSRDGGTGGTPCIVSPRQKGVTDSRASRSGGGGKHKSTRAAGGLAFIQQIGRLREGGRSGYGRRLLCQRTEIHLRQKLCWTWMKSTVRQAT